MTEPTLNELLAEQAYLRDSMLTMIEQRNALPRSDRKMAHDLLGEINHLQAEERKLRPAIARAREREERQEQHSLWCTYIVTKYGLEALHECFEWMKQERKRRRPVA